MNCLQFLMFSIIKNQISKRIRGAVWIDEESPIPEVETNEETTEDDRIIKIKHAIKKTWKNMSKNFKICRTLWL